MPSPVPARHGGAERDHAAGAVVAAGPAPAASGSGAADTPGSGPGRAPAGARAPGSLFAYGVRTPTGSRQSSSARHPSPPPRETPTGGHLVRGPYAVVHVSTTGFTPVRDRVVEVAIVRADASGRIRDEWVTLLDPAPRDVGPTFWHGLIAADVAGAPRFAEVAPALLGRLEGHVVVAHRAEGLEAFLAAELVASARLPPLFPALDTFRLALASVPTANHRLATLAAHAGLPVVPSGAALPDARLVAALLPVLVAPHEETLRYPVPLVVPRTAPADGPTRTRTHLASPVTPDPWFVSLLTRVRSGVRELNDPRVGTYVDALTTTLTLGRVAREESRTLARLATESGYSARDIRGIIEHLLESVRQAAFEEESLPPSRLRHLRAAAATLDVPGYFDDLVPPTPPVAPRPGSGTFSRPVRKPLPPVPPPWVARCGHCLSHGHYTATCPRLRGAGRSGAAGVGAVTPVRRVERI